VPGGDPRENQTAGNASYQAAQKPFVKRKVGKMTIVSMTLVHPRSGDVWDEVSKHIKNACKIAAKHGAENVTVLATVIGGPATNTVGILATSEDWAKFGQVQQAMLGDPKMQALMLEAGKVGTWETYVSQTIEL
jgi:hypothetical protein